MPAQQRLGVDHMQSVSPPSGEPGQGEKEHALVAVEPRPLDVATQCDDLLTQQGVFCHELRSRTGEVAGGADRQLRHRAGRSQQAPERPPEGDNQGNDQVRFHSGSKSYRRQKVC